MTKTFHTNQIPVINLENTSIISRRDDVVKQIKQACIAPGFFYVIDHGVSTDLWQSLITQADRFFSQSATTKMQCALSPTIRGYLPLGYKSYVGEKREGVSFQEGFWIGFESGQDDTRPLDGKNTWPEQFPHFRRAMQKYHKHIDDLANRLITLFAYALNYDVDSLHKLFLHPTSRLKINHYPVSVDEEEQIGVVPHTDSGAFTILWQDNSGGLEILDQQGNWLGAPPIENSFVVNLGNIMQLWSGDTFKATPHRVINKRGIDRYSIPYFVNPDQDALIQPLHPVTGDNSSSFRYGDYQLDLWRKTFPIANIR